MYRRLLHIKQVGWGGGMFGGEVPWKVPIFGTKFTCSKLKILNIICSLAKGLSSGSPHKKMHFNNVGASQKPAKQIVPHAVKHMSIV